MAKQQAMEWIDDAGTGQQCCNAGESTEEGRNECAYTHAVVEFVIHNFSQEVLKYAQSPTPPALIQLMYSNYK